MKLLISILIMMITSGCVMQRAVEITVKDDILTKRALTQFAWFNKNTTDNVVFSRETQSTKTLLSYDKASAEAQSDAIKAGGEAIGVAGGTAAKVLIKK